MTFHPVKNDLPRKIDFAAVPEVPVCPPPAKKLAVSTENAPNPSPVLVLPSTVNGPSDHSNGSCDMRSSADPVLLEREAAKSSPPPDESNVEMSDLTLNTENASKPSLGRVPPLFIKVPPNWTAFLAKLNSLVSVKIVAVRIGDSVKVQPKNISDFRAIQKFLEDTQHEFATFSLKADKPRKLAIRGLPSTLPVHEIIMDLTAQGFEVHKLHNIRRRGTNVPTNVFLLELLPLPNWERIYEVADILSIRVFIRKFVSRGPRQCFACNRWGHSSHSCRYPPRCLKCGGAHAPADCKLDRSQPPVCCNCSGAHTANFTGCPAAPRPRRAPDRPKAPLGAEGRPDQKIDAPGPSVQVPAADTAPASTSRQVTYAAKVKTTPKPKTASKRRVPPAKKEKIAPPEWKWPAGPSPFLSANAAENDIPATVFSPPANAPAPLKELMEQFKDLLQKMLVVCAGIHQHFK